MNYCNHCGNPLPEGAASCPSCNAPVTNDSQIPPQASPQQSQPNTNGNVPPQAPYSGTATNYSQPYATAPPAPQNQQTPPPYYIPSQSSPQKPKKTWLIVTICVGVVLVLFLAVVLTLRAAMAKWYNQNASRILDEFTISEPTYTDNTELTDAYSLIGLNFKVPSSLVWQSEEYIGNGAILQFEDKMVVQVNYSMALVDAEEYHRANRAYYQELDDVSSVSEEETVILGGEEWGKTTVTFNSDVAIQRVELYLFHSDTFQYSITLIYYDTSAEPVGDAILSSVTFTPIEGATNLIGVPDDFDKNVTDAENNFDANAVAASIVGEWEGGQGGYMIFHSDNTFEWFMDKTKDPNNVFRGTFLPTEPLTDFVSGAVQGFKAELNYEEVIINGVVTSAEAIPFRIRVYEFYEKGENSYQVEDLINGTHYNFEKVA